jgi:hypothetical protein
MDQNPSWVTNSGSVTQVSSPLPQSLRNAKVHYHVHKIPPMGPILRMSNIINKQEISLGSYIPALPNTNITLIRSIANEDYIINIIQ